MNASLQKIHRIDTPPTPFDANGNIDFGMVERLVEFHIRHGAEAICVPLHVGESPSLTELERKSVISFAAKTSVRRIPVIGHITRSGTILCIESVKAAADDGVDAVIITNPYYWSPTERDLLEHFRLICEASPVPVYLYNAPQDMYGAKLSVELLEKLLGLTGNFIGFVDLSGDWRYQFHFSTLPSLVGRSFYCYTDGDQVLSQMAMGWQGGFSALSSIVPQAVQSLFDRCVAQDFAGARSTQYKISAARTVFKDTLPAAVKYAMELLGRPIGDVRHPLSPLTEGKRELVRATLMEQGLLDAAPRGWD